MANSGSFGTGNYEGRYLTFSWQVQSQDITNNKTTISWSLTGSGNASSSWYYSGNFKVLIDGSQVYYSSDRIKLYNGTQVASGTYTFTHNNDGSRSFSAYAEAGIYNVAVNCTGSSSWSLPTIARASQPSINTWPNNSPDFNIGDTITIHMNRASSSFTHSVYFKYGSTTVTVATGVTNNCTFNTSTVANGIYALIPNATSYSGTVSVNTYNGSTLIGTKSCNYNAKVVNSNPTIGTVSYKDNNSTVTNVTLNNQIIVRNKSTLYISVSQITAKNYATLKSLTATINGVSKSFSINTSLTTQSNLNLSYGALNLSSDISCTITLTDSRNLVTTKSFNITIEDYNNPSAIITCNRKNNFYNETYLTVNGSCSSLNNHNTLTISYSTLQEGSSSWSAYVNINNNTQTTLNLDNEYSWSLRIKLVDSLNTQVIYNLTVGRGIPLIYFDRLNNSVGVNCFPIDQESLEVNGLNIYKAIVGTTLYQNASGTNASITLSDSLANYDYIEIYYMDNNVRTPTVSRFFNPNNLTIDLSIIECSSATNTYIRRSRYSASGTSLSLDTTSAGYILFDNTSAGITKVSGTNYIYIYKVVGFKY